MSKWVYSFGAGKAEGTAEMVGLLGGKGANLAEMAQLGLAVPPGFTLTTEICSHYYQHGRRYPADLKAEGFAASLQPANGSVRVRVGPFDDRTQAEATAKRLARHKAMVTR